MPTRDTSRNRDPEHSKPITEGAPTAALDRYLRLSPEHGDPIAVKHLLGQFIHRIEISTDWQAHPMPGR
jgi:hypothetical protein